MLTLSGICLDRESPVPLYEQLRIAIRKEISRSRRQPGVPLPAERVLGDTLSVNRNTVHRAYEALIAEGYLERPKGKRRIVTGPTVVTLGKPFFPSIGIVTLALFSESVIHASRGGLRYLAGTIDGATERRCSTIVLTLPPPEAPRAEAEAWVESFADRVVGIIHFGARSTTHDTPLELLLDERRFPQVCVSVHSDRPHIRSIYGDVIPGGTAAAALLREYGHRNVGVLRSEWQWDRPRLFRQHAETRSAEMLACFRDAGLAVRDEWIGRHCEYRENLVGELDRILALDERPTALWCQNDDMAFAIVDLLRERGLDVPGDLSVLGYDDIESGQVDEPFLTTLKHPGYAIGQQATDLLQRLYETGNENDIQDVKVPTALVVRRSVARPKRT